MGCGGGGSTFAGLVIAAMGRFGMAWNVVAVDSTRMEAYGRWCA